MLKTSKTPPNQKHVDNTAIWSVIKKGDTPHELILDTESTLEIALTTGAILCFAALLFIYWSMSPFSLTSVWGFVSILSIISACVLLYMRFLLNDYFLLDFQNKKLYFIRKFAHNQTQRLISTFDKFYALAINGKYYSNKNSSGWMYGLTLILDDGNTIELICPMHVSYDTVKTNGQALSKVMGIPFFPGDGNSTLSVETTSAGIEIKYTKHD